MRTVLITGSSSGIGKESAILFARKGWNVIATMRNKEGFAQFENSTNIHPYLMDVKDRQSIESCIEEVIQNHKRIDVLVNNAGIFTTDPLEQTTDENIDGIIDTNIKGVLYTTKIVLRYFREQRSGTIVNISSIAGRATFPFQSVYHTSKWAIEGLSESLFYELKPLNIRVKVVEPGVVKTNIYRSVLDIPFERYAKEYTKGFKKFHHFLSESYRKGYMPEVDAQTIYRAATSKSYKLRYTSDFTTRLVFVLKWIFPLRVFQFIIKQATIR